MLTVCSALVGPPLEALRPIEPVELAAEPNVFTLAVYLSQLEKVDF